jgi:maleylacetoacetate isomerase
MSHPHFTLYHYWRSSSSWRVRIALEYKKIPTEWVHVHLLNGESESAAHLERNPAGSVPVLECDDGEFITESLAIIRYLEELYPTPSLLPGTALDHARIWAMAEVINSGTAPLQSLGVMAYFSEDPAAQKKWSQHWIRSGLETYEKLASKTSGSFSHGDTFSLADACLVPQCYNAARYDIDFREFPTLSKAYDSSMKLEAVQRSHPDHYQPA